VNKLPVAKLNDGYLMPIVGLGTSRLAGAYEAVLSALRLGYRHIDTAAMYGNEAEVGRAVRDSGLPREEVFITTKLANDGHDDVKGEVQSSLKRLDLDYIDLYLVHWPMPKRVASWKALEKLVAEDAPIKSIGVSNFTIRHLEELLPQTKVIPAVNQLEFNPFVYSSDLLKFNLSRSEL
jgi:diketogulonate reductase-like aldo/keto reductase